MEFLLENITYGKTDGYPGSEDSLQRACVQYLEWHPAKPLFFHVPNGGKRTATEAKIFKGLGVKAGVADLIVLEPRALPHRRSYASGLIVELKVGKNTPTDAQIAFLKACYERGFYVAVCYHFDAFKAVVDDYFKLMPCT